MILRANILPSYWSVYSPLVTYLVSHWKILAILCAPTDSAVQAFIHITVPLIRPVSTIISTITEISLRDAASIGAHEEGAIAQASWKEQDMVVTGTTPCNFSIKLGKVIGLTTDLDRLFRFKEALLVVAPFVPSKCSCQFPGRVVLLVTLMKKSQLRAIQQSYLRPDTWGSEAVRQSGRDSLHSCHTPTESWEDSGRPCSEIPLIYRSDRLEKEIDTFSLSYTWLWQLCK